MYFCQNRNVPESDYHRISQEDTKHLWIPPVSFADVSDLSQIQMYGGQIENTFWLKRPRSLEFDEKLKLTLPCHFEFKNFPFDSHVCHLNFGDILYETSDLVFMPAEVAYKK